MTFKKGHPLYTSTSTRPRYDVNRPRKADYDPVLSVPDGLRWKPSPYRKRKDCVVMFSFGNFYKLERSLVTGEVKYYQKRADSAASTPAEKIDSEPKRDGQVRYRVGAKCWYLDGGRRFLVDVVARAGKDRATWGEPKTITIKSATGWDADRVAPWPFDELFTFPAYPSSPLFCRLRPLKDRSV